ncbi:HTH_48 domain-containing protein [Trichonephila clavipes]|uniref:HTH_48 domain-containing protein n=1 Tax=Trichonephila clavipes TaxID=2585209 RepID=A0A8X6S6S3_TRICX|nr:HTH_48 domain-containing protein [Trichonephila clavipes]
MLSSFASDLDTTQRKHLQNFKERESIEDGPRSGRPSVSKNAENVVIRDLVRSDRRLTVRMIGEELNLNQTTTHQILSNELKMRKICAKMVPKNLSQSTVSWPGHHFGTLENIQTAVTDQLKDIPISEFNECYEEWKKRLQRCVASESSYFDGDNVELECHWPQHIIAVYHWAVNHVLLGYHNDQNINQRRYANARDGVSNHDSTLTLGEGVPQMQLDWTCHTSVSHLYTGK